MKINNSVITYSPTDLILYMESPFASWMEHYAILSPDTTPSKDLEDPMMTLLQRKGNEHEANTLAAMKVQGFNIITIDGTENLISRTIDAMQSGADIIYQAALQKQPFYGRADFLVKVQGKSKLGDYHYEVWDTKFSRNPKSYYVIQLCCYAEMLEEIQGIRSKNIAVILSNNETITWETESFFYYYLNFKKSFLHEHKNFNLTNIPDPFESRKYGNWEKYAKQLLLAKDHLSQTANITRSQIRKMNKAGISTMQGLADYSGKTIQGIDADVQNILIDQAKIQKNNVGLDKPLFKVKNHPPEQKQGLSTLPLHSAHDIFFDIEGYPLAEDGLEYLWGCVFFDNKGNRAFKDFWAHTRIDEEQAFKRFIEWAYSLWQQDPSMHIYHYGNYEVAVCRRLMGRYGICEYEVDQLLRNEVFIDLYTVIKRSIFLGEPKYSIKNVERLYRDKRATEVETGDESIVAYEHWCTIQDGETWKTSKILNDIRDYNIDDCNSTQELVAFLRKIQSEHHIEYAGKSGIIVPETKHDNIACMNLRNALLKQALELSSTDPSTSRISELLAWSLEFHRREKKPVFWRLFDRKEMEHHELLDDIDCLANCVRTEKPAYFSVDKSGHRAYEFMFDPGQEFKGISKEYCILSSELSGGEFHKASLLNEHCDFENGILVVQAKFNLPNVITLIPFDYIDSHPIPGSIYAIANNFYNRQLQECAILDFLKRDIPRIQSHERGKPIAPSNDPDERLEQLKRAIKSLDNSYLVIQGPPGSGKTYTAARLIGELVKDGLKIGICSNSHKAINKLLITTAEYCEDNQINALFISAKDTDKKLHELGVSIVKKNADIRSLIHKPCVVGTTAWGFSRDDLANAFDYLFIDEAGQVSVANLIGMSRSAKNIVIIGDQMQLGQPIQGSHPGNSGLSILDYLLHDQPTIPEELGVFLGMTYRMHSAINNFISKGIYENKLISHPDNDQQVITVPDNYSGNITKTAGIIYVPIKHEGNTQASDEEVIEINKIVSEMIGRKFTDKAGKQRLISLADILIVAPYNYQVIKLKKSLGEYARIGTVDKFQGQEAPIVILSMCASNAHDSSRGINFLFDKNRLNVAISRAQCLAIVVSSTRLTEFIATNLQQVTMANLFCRLVQYA